MTETIRLPSGEEFQFPDGVPDEEKARAIDQYVAAQKSNKPSFWDKAGEEFKKRDAQLSSGVVTGLAGLVSLPGTAERLVGDAAHWTSNKVRSAIDAPPLPEKKTDHYIFPDFETVKASILGAPKTVDLPDPAKVKPDDTAGRVLQSTGEMIGAGPFKAAMPFNFVGGAAGGLLESAFPDEWWSRPVGQMGGALGVAGAQLIRSTPQQLAGKATQNLTPEDWSRASQLQQRGQQAGVPLAANEAIAKTSADPISALAGDVRASQRGGAVMEKFFQDRLPQIKDAAQKQIATVGEKVDDPIAVGLRAQKASESALAAPKIERANAAKQFFERARSVNLPQNITDDIVSQIDNVATSANPEGPILKALTDIKSKVIAAKGNVGQIDEVLKVYDDILKAGAFESGAPLGEAIRVNVKPVLASIRDTLKNNVDDYARGMEIYAGRPDLGPSMYTSQVNRAENSALTPLANTTPGTATTAKFETIVLGGENARPESIKFAVRALSKQDPQAASNAVRLHLENSLDDAFQRLQSGPNAAAGAKFSKLVGGTEQQRANLFAALDSLPANGQAVSGRSAGFKNLLEILEQTGTTPGLGSPTATRGITNRALAEGGALNSTMDAVNIVQGGPIGPLSRWWQDLRMGKGYEELAKILTDPDSVAKLQQLSVLKPNSTKAQLLAAELLAGGRALEAMPQ